MSNKTAEVLRMINTAKAVDYFIVKEEENSWTKEDKLNGMFIDWLVRQISSVNEIKSDIWSGQLLKMCLEETINEESKAIMEKALDKIKELIRKESPMAMKQLSIEISEVSKYID